MIPQWFVFAALGGLSSNLFNFLSRFFLREDEDSTAYAWFFETAKCVLILPIAFLFDWKVKTDLSSILALLAVGIIEFFAIYFHMKMHKFTHLSISSVLSRTRMIWVPLLGFFILREHLKSIEYFGVFLLFLGTSVVVSPKHLVMDKGVRYTTITAFLNAVNVIALKLATGAGSNSVVIIALSLPSFIIFPLIMKNGMQRIIVSFKQGLLIKFLAVVFNILSIYLALFALRSGSASTVNAIYQGMIIFNVLAGIFILKEKEDIGKKLLGTAITIIGVVLLS